MYVHLNDVINTYSPRRKEQKPPFRRTSTSTSTFERHLTCRVCFFGSSRQKIQLEILTMDFSFAPSNFFRDLYRTKHPHTELLDDVAVSEVQLDVERRKGNFRGTPFGSAWNDFLSQVQEHVVWTDDQAFVCAAEEVGWKIGYRRFFSLTATTRSNNSAPPTSTHSSTKLYVWAPCLQAAVDTCDIISQILATCSGEINSVFWMSMAGNLVEFPVSARVLATYLEHQKQSLFTMESFTLSTELCRVLATLETGSDIIIELSKCRFRGDTAARCLAESLRNSDVGPKFRWTQCDVDFRHVTTALTGISRLTSLKLSRSSCAYLGPPKCLSDAELDLIFKALGKNQGLLELDLSLQPVCDSNFFTLGQSLMNHTTLQCLNLTATQHWKASSSRHFAATESKGRRPAGLQAVNTILQLNTELHTVHLSSLSASDQDFVHRAIRPRLRFNTCRRRVHLIQRAQTTIRQQVLGRALGTVNDDPNLVWLFVSNNMDALCLARGFLIS
jgi:hypothetical protein